VGLPLSRDASPVPPISCGAIPIHVPNQGLQFLDHSIELVYSVLRHGPQPACTGFELLNRNVDKRQAVVIDRVTGISAVPASGVASKNPQQLRPEEAYMVFNHPGLCRRDV